MTTSRFASSCSAVVLCLVACSDPVKPEQCHNDDQAPINNPPETALLRARVTIEHLVTLNAAGARTETNSVTAELVDASTTVQTPRKQNTMIGSPGCYGLTGKPVTECRQGLTAPCTLEQLDAEKIEVTGLAAGGTIVLDRTTKGIFDKEQLPSPLFGSGPVTVRITGRKEKGWFPSMDLQVRQPAPLELKEPAGGKPLGAGDVMLRWAASDADRVVVNASLSPDPDPPDDLQCVIVDDGCTALLTGDLDTFDMKAGSTVKLIVLRENSQVKVDGDAALEVKAISRVSMTVTR